MSFESAIEKIGHELNPVEFGEAIFQTAIQNPINAISQLTGDKLPQLHLVNVSNDTFAAKFGSILGFVGDFAVLNKFAGMALNPILGEASTQVWAGALKGGIAGAAYGGLLTPSGNGADLLKSRLESAALYGGTFAVVGGLSSQMSNRLAFKGAAVGGRIFGSAIVGGAGVADTVGVSALANHQFPTWNEMRHWSMTPPGLAGSPEQMQGTTFQRIQRFFDGLDPDNHTRPIYQPFQGYFGVQPPSVNPYIFRPSTPYADNTPAVPSNDSSLT